MLDDRTLSSPERLSHKAHLRPNSLVEFSDNSGDGGISDYLRPNMFGTPSRVNPNVEHALADANSSLLQKGSVAAKVVVYGKYDLILEFAQGDIRLHSTVGRTTPCHTKLFWENLRLSEFRAACTTALDDTR